MALTVNRRFCRDMLTRIPSSVFSGCLRRRVEGEFDRVVGRSAVSRRSLPHPLSAPIQAGAFIYPRRGKRLFFFPLPDGVCATDSPLPLDTMGRSESLVAPFLSQVDAALDLSHTQNIGQIIKQKFKNSQFIIVSLKDNMFNNANVLFR